MTVPLPSAALSQHVIILGKTGAGKSSTMRLLVEGLLSDGKPVCIIDPKGDWWGLKSSASGKQAGFPVVIFGGEHADIPLTVHAGGYVAEMVATGNRPCIADLGGWTVSDRTRFFVDFAQTLFRHTRGPRWLVVDECHNFASQGKVIDPQAGLMLHWANRIASEGRGKGITLLSASQRPQKVSKDYLTSHETLIAMRVIHPLDRRAIEEWIDGCPDPDKGKEVLRSLASLKRGEAWVWSPEIGFGPQCIQFPLFATYDSFAAPTGENIAKLKGWAEVDLEEVKTKLAAVVEEAKANDPAALKAEIARLKRDLAARIDPQQIVNAEAFGYARGVATATEMLRTIRTRFDEVSRQVHELLAETAAKAEKTSGQVAPTPSRPARPIRPEGTAAIVSPSAPQRKVLTSLAFWASIGQDAPTRPMVAAVAGYAPSSGGFNNLIGSARTAGLLDIPSAGRVSLTAAGEAAGCGMSIEEARSFLLSVLSVPQRKLVEAAIGFAEMTREELAAATDYSAGSGGFNNLIGSLCTIDVFAKPRAGSIAVTDWVRQVLG